MVEARGMTTACCPGGRGMSSAAELSAARLVGADHPAVRVDRSDTQMSTPPLPPGRSEPNQSVSPSAEMAELVSKESVLTPATGAGALNGSSMLERSANQMSPAPAAFRLVVK